MLNFSKLSKINTELTAEEIFQKLQNLIISHPDYKTKYNNFLNSSFTTLYSNILINLLQSFGDKLEISINNLFPSTVTNEDAAYQILNLIGYPINGTEPAVVDVSFCFTDSLKNIEYFELPSFFSLQGINVNNTTSNFEFIKQTSNNEFDYISNTIILNINGNYSSYNDIVFKNKLNTKLKMFSGTTYSQTYIAQGIEAEEIELILDDTVQLSSFRVYKKINGSYISMKKVDNFIIEDYNSSDYSNIEVYPYVVYKKNTNTYAIVFGLSGYTNNKIPKKDEEFIIFYRKSLGKLDNINSYAINTTKDFIIQNIRYPVLFVNETKAEGGKDKENALDLIMSLVQKQKTLSVSNFYRKKQEEDYKIILQDLSNIQNSISFGLKQFPTGIVNGEEKLLHSNDVFTYVLKKANYLDFNTRQELEDNIRLDLYETFYTNYILNFEDLKFDGLLDTKKYAKLPKKCVRYKNNSINITYEFFITTKEVYRFTNNYEETYNFHNANFPTSIVDNSSNDFFIRKINDDYYICVENNILSPTYDNFILYMHFFTKENYYFNYNEIFSFTKQQDNSLKATINSVIKKIKPDDFASFFAIKITSEPSIVENYYDILNSLVSPDDLRDSDKIIVEINNNQTIITIPENSTLYSTFNKTTVEDNIFYIHYLISREIDTYNSVISQYNEEQQHINYLSNYSMLKVDDYIKQPIIYYFSVSIKLYIKSNLSYSNAEIKKIVETKLREKYNLAKMDFGEQVYISDIADIVKNSSEYIKYFTIEYLGLSYNDKDANIVFNNTNEKILTPDNAIAVLDFNRYYGSNQTTGVILNTYVIEEA